ncbi:MAG: cupin domain-containing protein [Saprospiraceae bacterium]|nr:cupin domain-containing protein [Saprospiraceae bacterium]
MVKNITEFSCFEAGDLTKLREILHPAVHGVDTMFSLAHAYLAVGEKSLPHRVTTSSETYYILEGIGQIFIEGKVFSLQKNDVAFVPANALQWVKNTGEATLSFLCIVSPPWSAAGEEVYDEKVV